MKHLYLTEDNLNSRSKSKPLSEISFTDLTTTMDRIARADVVTITIGGESKKLKDRNGL